MSVSPNTDAHRRSATSSPAPDDSLARGNSTRRKNRYRSGGGFLLNDSISGDKRFARGSARKSILPNGKSSDSPWAGKELETGEAQPSSEHEQTSHENPGSTDNLPPPDASRPSTDQDTLPHPSIEEPTDMDSTQIVQMALNLSESRRIASRRHVSRATPPRLGPVPDGSQPGHPHLQQHLQQQRRSSYNTGLNIHHGNLPRTASGRIDSPLQTSFDAGQDQHYRYHFSNSTLARAQKAKEHLELMAQYRRLLEVLPPLRDIPVRNWPTSPPTSPIANKPFNPISGYEYHKGRQYNPLQYIRNRKVRARERKVIDGERQGFGDVEGVKPWVDRVVEKAKSAAPLQDGESVILPFPGAEEHVAQASSGSSARTAARLRRPRVDWFIEPCDIVADAYWLEQEDHKELIEDHDWNKIFPPKATMSRPVTREPAADPVDTIPPFSMQDDNDPEDPSADAEGITRIGTEGSYHSTKHRAKQTLHNIRSFPHRHQGGHGMHPTDLIRNMKDSTPEVSGSESESKSRLSDSESKRGDTIKNNHKNSLDSKMLEAITSEHRDQSLQNLPSDTEEISYAGFMTPERRSQPPSRFHSRKGSLVDTSDSDRMLPLDKSILESPPRFVPGRHSLDMGVSRRKQSADQDNSLPTSPDLRPSKGLTEPVDSSHLSPSWSRSGSPTRNPISKIKQLIRDKSTEQDESRRISAPAERATLPELDTERRQSSPTRLPSSIEQSPIEQQRGHRRTESSRMRHDDQAATLRGMFKPPRLDIRSGVSKLGDKLRINHGSSEELDVESTSESEGERLRSRGRSRLTDSLSRHASKQNGDGSHSRRHFLDVMPSFSHALDHRNTHSSNNSGVDLTAESANHSRQSSRHGLLRPPRIHTRSDSSSASPQAQAHDSKPGGGESDISEAESWQGNVPDGVRNAATRLSSATEGLQVDDDGRSHKSRHWSIADKGTLNEEAPLTRREVARMRALILSSGVKAMEINRRAQEVHKPFRHQGTPGGDGLLGPNCGGIVWSDIVKHCPDASQLRDRQTPFCDLYPLAGRALSNAIQNSGRRWQASADQFLYQTSPQLQNRIGDVRSRIADDLSERTRQAGEEADETNRDLALGQPLKSRAVVDIIEKMLRRRRRRLRWVRRALWLAVEWVLVGFMWYVWFMVMILRVFVGVGRGAVNVVRWLLWM